MSEHITASEEASRPALNAGHLAVKLGLLALLPVVGWAQPRIFYTDLDSGPNSSGENNGGAWVSVYGERFGASQGSSRITVGGGPVAAYRVWSDAKITFQLGAAASTGDLMILTGGGMSNSVPFTVRAGNIYFVASNGNDSNTGSFDAPWKTLPFAIQTAGASTGNIIYALNGVSQATDDGRSRDTALTLRAEWCNATGYANALVAYPGATVTIGSEDGSPSHGLGASCGGFWTFAGINFRGANPVRLAGPSAHWRFVANDITCPNAGNSTQPSDSCFGTSQASYIKFFGNQVHEAGATDASSQFQAVTFSNDSNHLEIGWNTISNGRGCGGLQIHSAPLGDGSSGDPAGLLQYDINIHDNLIHDTQCDGLVLDTIDPSKGPVLIHNNIVFNAGKGPNTSDSRGGWACINIPHGGDAHHNLGTGVVEIYNNTLYNCGSFTTPPYGASNAGISFTGNPAFSGNIRNNIIYENGLTYYDNGLGVTQPVPYLVIRPDGGAVCTSADSCGWVFGQNNLFYGYDAPPSSHFADSLRVDPSFVNPGSDFHLSAGSPAARAGTPIAPDTTDFDGIVLPQGSGYPVGAYAYAAAPSGSPVSLNISPATVTLLDNQTQVFRATVRGSLDTGVTWSLSPAVGTLSSSGLYTAPGVITTQQTILVTATSTSDTARSASATVYLTPGSVSLGAEALIVSAAAVSDTINSIRAAAPNVTSSTSSWYSNGTTWTNRKLVTIDHTKVSGSSNLSNFPLLFSVTDFNLRTVANGGSVGKSDGSDILFTAADGVTKLNHELESYNPATGQLVAWVQVPAVSPALDTGLYVYYGNAAAGNQQNPAAVWDSNFKAVYHMGNGAGVSASDSTPNANHATNHGATPAAGQIGGGSGYNGAGQFIATPLTNLAYSSGTISWWMNPASPYNDSAQHSFFGQGTGSADANASIGTIGGGKLLIGWTPGGQLVSFNATPSNYPQNNWVYYTWSWDASGQRVYVNGVLAGSNGYHPTSGNAFEIGRLGSLSGNAAYFWNGKLDEFRISSTVRSPAWTITEYNNQKSTATFFAVGAPQSPGAPLPSAVAAPAFNPGAGTYPSAQTVSITTSTAGASIRFTTDGTTPTETVGTLYSAPFNISSSTTVNAIAFKSGMTDSTVSSATYTINSGGNPWFNAAWTNRKPVTIDHTKVAGGSNLSNFPLLFSVTDPSLRTVANGGSVGKADGSDILFTAADGVTKLNHELESYNPATGQLVAWVQVPVLSPNSDTGLYLYHGNAAAGNQQSPAAVWDSNFKAVYHMGNPAGLSTSDSTSNANHGTNNGATPTPGQMGGGSGYNGAQFISTPLTNLGFPSGTISWWMNPANSYTDAAQHSFFGQGMGTSDANASQGTLSGGKLQIGWTPGGQPVSFSANASNYPQNTWVYYAWSWDASGQRVYVNGVLAGSNGYHPTSGNAFEIGRLGSLSGNAAYFWNGKLDEFRISSSMRSPGWTMTEYNNQKSPATFLAVGALQSSGAPPPSAVAAPAFNPGAGTYPSAQMVSITTSTAGATIRFTTDGVTTPSQTVGTVYSGPISISTTTTLTAIAYATGMTDSALSSATYTITPPSSPVAAPAFNPGAGTYTAAQTVNITSSTAGASIRYTTDGTTPTEAVGTLYTGAVSVSSTTTLKAMAFKTGMSDSAVSSAAYTITPPATVAAPAFNPGAGTYTAAQTVNITSSTTGATIRYTTDGTTPTQTVGTLYTGAISVSSTTTLKAMAYETGMTGSAVSSATYTITPPATVAAPNFNPGAGNYTLAQTVSITTSTSGASIRYTTNGSTPSPTVGTLYVVPVIVGSTTTLNAIAYKTGMTNSAVSSATYTITLPVLHTVSLTWAPSTSPSVTGYNVYRGTTSGGPYTKINSSLVSGTSFADPNALGGLIYYYVATAVDSSGGESGYSPEAQAVIPLP